MCSLQQPIVFDLVRTDHFNVESMKELFEKVPADSILAYLKETYLIDFKIIYMTCLSTMSCFYSTNTCTLSFLSGNILLHLSEIHILVGTE